MNDDNTVHSPWDRDHDVVISRLLNRGGLSALKWLRANISDNEFHEFILSRSGAGMSPQRLRYGEIIVHLPHRKVRALLKFDRRTIWDRRSAH